LAGAKVGLFFDVAKKRKKKLKVKNEKSLQSCL